MEFPVLIHMACHKSFVWFVESSNNRLLGKNYSFWIKDTFPAKTKEKPVTFSIKHFLQNCKGVRSPCDTSIYSRQHMYSNIVPVSRCNKTTKITPMMIVFVRFQVLRLTMQYFSTFSRRIDISSLLHIPSRQVWPKTR